VHEPRYYFSYFWDIFKRSLFVVFAKKFLEDLKKHIRDILLVKNATVVNPTMRSIELYNNEANCSSLFPSMHLNMHDNHNNHFWKIIFLKLCFLGFLGLHLFNGLHDLIFYLLLNLYSCMCIYIVTLPLFNCCSSLKMF
jgi:hypothetical protein